MPTNPEKALITEQTLTDIADAIRYKKQSSGTYLPSEMPGAVRSITSMRVAVQNATLNLTGSDASVEGEGPVTRVNVNGITLPLNAAPPDTQPVIRDGIWWVWNSATGTYVNTGVSAIGPTGPQGPKGDTGDVTPAAQQAVSDARAAAQAASGSADDAAGSAQDAQAAAAGIAVNLSAIQSDIAIIIEGNQTTHTGGVAVGQYVIVRNSTISDIADGLYKAVQAISANTAIDSTYLTAVDGGGLNVLNSHLIQYLNTTISVPAVPKGDATAIDIGTLMQGKIPINVCSFANNLAAATIMLMYYANSWKVRITAVQSNISQGNYDIRIYYYE